MSHRSQSPVNDPPAHASTEDPAGPLHPPRASASASPLPVHLLSLVPEMRLSQEARRPCGQHQVEGEAKDSINRT